MRCSAQHVSMGYWWNGSRQNRPNSYFVYLLHNYISMCSITLRGGDMLICRSFWQQFDRHQGLRILLRVLATNGNRLVNIYQKRINNRAALSVRVPSNMGKRCGFTSSCACARSHLNLCFPFIHSTVSNDSVKAPRPKLSAYAWRHVYALLGPIENLCYWKVISFVFCTFLWPQPKKTYWRSAREETRSSDKHVPWE